MAKKIEELFTAKEGEALDSTKVISELKKRPKPNTDIEKAKKQLQPLEHDVFNKSLRPDKKVKVDPEDIIAEESVIKVTGADGAESTGYRWEKVARIALAIQKLIVKRAVSFLFGNPVTLDATPEGEGQETVLKAVKRILYDNKEKSMNRKVARTIMSCTEVAELWYQVEKKANYGFDSKWKLRCAILSPLNGDTLYPYFDESGDMVAFSREFVVTDGNNVSTNYFETWTDKFRYLWIHDKQNGWLLMEGFPEEVAIGKIPVVYGSQEQTEWEDVQVLIDRLEKLLSNFADTNDYHAAPKIFVQGKIEGFSKKGESGAILEGEAGSTASYLSWANAPESVKLEIETLLKMIYTITQTPDISFDAVKGIGSISGIALELLFMDAHLKVQDHCEVFDEYLQRRLNIIKAFVGQFKADLKDDAEDLQVEPVIVPYMIRDKAAELKIWQDANGGNPIVSQKASFQKAALTSDPEADFEQYQAEQSAKNTFSFNEPTEA